MQQHAVVAEGVGLNPVEVKEFGDAFVVGAEQLAVHLGRYAPSPANHARTQCSCRPLTWGNVARKFATAVPGPPKGGPAYSEQAPHGPGAMQRYSRSGWWPRRPHYPCGAATTLIAPRLQRPKHTAESSMPGARRFVEERRPGGALASPQVQAKWSTNYPPQARPDMGTGGYRDRRGRTVQRRLAQRHRGRRTGPADAQPDGPGGPGRGSSPMRSTA